MLNYKMNQALFPTVKELEKQCKIFDNYYSTATSTLMVIGDLLYGGMNLYEGCESLASIPKEYCYASSFFDDLKEQEYHVGIYIYPEGGDRETAEKRHIAGFKNRMELIRKYSKYVDSFGSLMDHQPFALMACNYISSLSFSRFLDIGNYGMEMDYWEASYRCMDRCCGDLLKLLKDKNLMSNTVIVLYGDHGDDYWGHGMHKGLTHAIEPNNLLIHTPLIIWDGIRRKEPEHDQRLIQTSDLREMIMALVHGRSIENLPNRQYAISRSAYAAQPIRAESFNKAYSATDGRYLLMVSSRGLEMYDTKMDPACQNNVLRFFNYENEILKPNEKNQEFFQYHFSDFWNKREQRILRQRFYELKDVLYNRVLDLYMAGNRSEKDMLDEMKFEKIDSAFDKETG